MCVFSFLQRLFGDRNFVKLKFKFLQLQPKWRTKFQELQQLEF